MGLYAIEWKHIDGEIIEETIVKKRPDRIRGWALNNAPDGTEMVHILDITDETD